MRKIPIRATWPTAILAATLVALPALASTPLPPPVGGGSGGAAGFYQTGYSFGLNSPEQFSFAIGGTHLSASGAAVASGTPHDSSEISADVPPQGSASSLFQGGANLYYYFEVFSPETISLNLYFDGELSSRGSNADAQALARLFIFDADSGLFNINNSIFVGYSACGTLDERSCNGSTRTTQYISEVASIHTNQLYGVYQQVFTSINIASSSSAYAYADPYFYLSSQDSARGLTLTFSPGAGNNPISSVPEPASWAMMLVGFGALGGALRRSRYKAYVRFA